MQYVFPMVYSIIGSFKIHNVLLWTLVLLALGNSLIKTNQEWGNYHYYVNSKYFNELGYFQLYECSIDGPKPRRDLYNYTFRIDEPNCVAEFNQSRFDNFRADIQAIRANPQAMIDKGYNGTPTYTAIFGTLANVLHTDHIWLVDVVALVIALFTIVYFRGWRVAGYVALFTLTYEGTIDRLWGHYAQWVWFACVLIGIALLDKKHPAGSIFLAVATSLVLFPVFLMVRYIRHKTLIIVYGVSLIIVMGVGLLQPRGINGYVEFLKNMRIHSYYIKDELIIGNIGLQHTINFTEDPSLQYMWCFIEWDVTCDTEWEYTNNLNTWLALIPFHVTSPLGAVFSLLTISNFYWLVIGIIPLWYEEKWTRGLLFIQFLMYIPIVSGVLMLLTIRHWVYSFYLIMLGAYNVRETLPIIVKAIRARLYPPPPPRDVSQ